MIDDYVELVNRGVYLQINLLSLISYYSKSIYKNRETNPNEISKICWK